MKTPDDTPSAYRDPAPAERGLFAVVPMWDRIITLSGATLTHLPLCWLLHVIIIVALIWLRWFVFFFAGSCVKCSKPVYGASQACQAMGSLYHDSCFTCSACSKYLISFTCLKLSLAFSYLYYLWSLPHLLFI